MAILLALLAALTYGGSDFAAGLASRRIGAGPVAAGVQALSLLTVAVSLVLYRGIGPTWHAVGWGAASGIGNALGTLALYRGFAIGRMSVVATLSAVLTAGAPVLVGVGLGDHLSTAAAIGIVVAIPAIALVSWQGGSTGARAGVIEGAVSGIGFALLFIALDRAGTRSGAWPLIAGQATALVLLLPFALRTGRLAKAYRSAATPVIMGGILGGASNLLFLAATGEGSLAIVAVLASLYPVATILLARICLNERWTSLQAAGLVCAGIAVALISSG
ncbi:MAG TPA: DMT family transporter [Gammaproteobacteria bacterium]|nr:DMT family transporter [Gammaproteobacteria bacterium]